MKLPPTIFLREKISSFKSQFEMKSNPSKQIEVLTQLKISIWLIKAFIFNASKLFNSKHYPYDNDDMSLDKLLMKFTILKVKNALCKVELLEFIETLRCECDNKWWNPTPHILSKAHPPKRKNKEQNGRTHIREDKWTTQEGEPQGEHQVPEPPPMGRSISNKEN